MAFTAQQEAAAAAAWATDCKIYIRALVNNPEINRVNREHNFFTNKQTQNHQR